MFEAKEWTNCLNNKQGCRCTEAKRRNRYSRTFSAWAAIKFEFIVSTRLTEFTWLTYQQWKLSVQNEMFLHFPLHMPNGLHSSNTRTHTMAALTRIIYSHRMCTPVRWLSASFICWKLYDGNVYLCAWFSARNPLENYHKYLICWLLHADQPIFNNIQSSFELFHRQPFYHLIWWFSVW